jgi:uncharacterized protein YjgD (DUF1641 family)
MLRNVNNLTAAFEQWENLRGFLEDFAPVSRQLSLDLMRRLDEFDRKGYFDFVREAGSIADNVVTSFSPQDVRALAENIVTILGTIKNLTQPDMLQALNNAVTVYKKLDITVKEDVSLFGLVREMNTPEVKRGMAFMLQFLKNLANTTESSQQSIQPVHHN